MKKFGIIIWAGFLLILLVFIYYDYFYLEPGIVCFQFADAIKGKSILSGWQADKVLSIARAMIWLDFAYIFFYVSIFITLSNRQIRKEPSIGLNALLRANFLFAFLAGFFDIIENISHLFTIRYWATSYFNAIWATWLKFIFFGWAVLIWLISYIKSKIKG